MVVTLIVVVIVAIAVIVKVAEDIVVLGVAICALVAIERGHPSGSILLPVIVVVALTERKPLIECTGLTSIVILLSVIIIVVAV